MVVASIGTNKLNNSSLFNIIHNRLLNCIGSDVVSGDVDVEVWGFQSILNRDLGDLRSEFDLYF